MVEIVSKYLHFAGCGVRSRGGVDQWITARDNLSKLSQLAEEGEGRTRALRRQPKAVDR